MRKEKEKHNLEMEQLAQDLIATLRESLLVLDGELCVRVANRAFYRTFQAEPEEVDGHGLYELGNGQWNIPQLRQALQEIVAQGTPLEDFAVEQQFPHIGHKVMLINARRVEREAGAEPLILIAIDDVTEQRQAAATIQTYLHKLEWSNR
ncbi:MAG TPA: PAS domain-containing protein, partial [Abditibacteriaceae bacterium]